MVDFRACAGYTMLKGYHHQQYGKVGIVVVQVFTGILFYTKALAFQSDDCNGQFTNFCFFGHRLLKPALCALCSHNIYLATWKF